MLQRFDSLVREAPEAAALIDGTTGFVTTRAMLRARAEALAAELAASGVQARDGFAIQLPNSVDFVATFLAAVQLDLVVFLIDRDATANEVAAIHRHFGIGRSAAVPPDARLVKLTSGSTAMPKGIVTTEANLVADCTNICATMGIAPADVNLGAIPFSHSYGFSNLVMPLLVQGTPVVVSNDYLPQSLVDLANAYRCTVAPLIPMVFEHLAVAAHGAFETVRTFLSAGAPLPAPTSR
ncbi:MAG TPA: class I adenylate-forming enzyme family protein, partial [Thermoanaerobaculia bacterium]|nr:class I adenylate-forming enzyme family protein [Thermoanaerobaculia bacterium]